MVPTQLHIHIFVRAHQHFSPYPAAKVSRAQNLVDLPRFQQLPELWGYIGGSMRYVNISNAEDQHHSA